METIVDCLAKQARVQPSARAFTYIEDDGSHRTICYGELHLKAAAIAAGLAGKVKQGENVVLLFPPSIEYIETFLGCLYAGAVAVPLYPPGSRKHYGRIVAVIEDCGAVMALTTSSLASAVAEKLAPLAVSSGELTVVLPTTLPEPPSPLQLAFLQYTSGSTGSPKGVMVSHGNVISNLKALEQTARCSSEDVFCNWLPLFHDLGLINTLLLPIYLGSHSVLMSPVRFMQHPLAWLKSISENQATIAGAPNFGFDHCINRISPDQLGGVDLSSWRVAFSGAEPVDVRTLRGFAERFAVAGFKEAALYPAYGMAEATVFIAAGNPMRTFIAREFDSESLQTGRAETVREGRKGQSLVSCGAVAPGHFMRIVSPRTFSPLADGEIGEIWFSGPSVAQGYWNDAERTRAAFGMRLRGDDRDYLRTGDLGFIHEGELFISGRIKDILIIRGRNFHPQDLERIACESSPGLVHGGGIAFEVSGRAALIQEVGRAARRDFDYEQVARSIQAAVLECFEFVFDDIVFVRSGKLPRTSSGKLQRALTRHRYLSKAIESLYSIRDSAATGVVGFVAPATQLEERLCALWEEELGIDQIGTHADFLALGGHSLLASRLVSRIGSECNCQISITDLFETKCIRRLAEVISGRAANTVPPLTRSARRDQGPLSYMQQSLWLVDQIDPGKNQYNVFKSFEIGGYCDVAALELAFGTMLERHPVLRTVVRVTTAGEPLQSVLREYEFSMPVIDLTDLSDESQSAAVARHIEAEAARPFDLTADLMLRVQLLKLGAASHVLCVALHHIACDGWSEHVLVTEVSAIYKAAAAAAAHSLLPLEFQYIDYAHWQRTWLQGEVLEGQLKYWRQRLTGLPTVHGLRLDHPRPAAQSYQGAAFRQTFDQEILHGLSSLASAHDATLFMVLNAAFSVLLARHGSENDIVMGTAVANRDQPQLASVVGLFANTLVSRADCSGNPAFDVFLRHCKASLLGAYEHQQLPFEKLVDELQPERSLSHSPLFQIKLVLQNNPVSSWDLPGLAIEAMAGAIRVTKHDLSVDAYVRKDGLILVWEYATALFDHSTIERMAAHLNVLLKAIVLEPRTRIRALPILTPAEERQILIEWNDSARDHIRGKCIHELFEARVRRHPNGIAVVSGAQQLTYEQLNEQANRIAHYLIEQGVGRNTLVGLCVERSVETVIGIMAILKAGAAYVPIDPSYPSARIQYVLRDAAIEMVLTEQQLLGTLPLEGLQVLPLDAELREALLSGYSARNIDTQELGLLATDLAYVIYTSGSTGEPKGVMLEHEGVCNLAQWQSHYYDVRPQSRVAQFASYSFDGSVGETFMALLNGATLVILDRHRSPSALLQSINEHEIETLVMVPSLLKELDPSLLTAGRHLTVVAVGEMCPVELAQKWAQHCKFRNGYGPTECTVYSHIWAYPEDGSTPSNCVPIGKPMDNIAGYILDEHRQPVPAGVVGELYLSGVGLARGYLNRPELTAEKFCRDSALDALLDSLGASSTARTAGQGRCLYRTGDVVAYRPDGNIEFVGRADHQVKLHGIRIELAEVEARLLEHEAISAAVAVIRDEPERLVAYVVYAPSTDLPEEQHEARNESLRAHLRRTSPDYMVPSVFVELPRLPLTPTGKLDRKALPSTDRASLASATYVAPQTHTEEWLCDLWRTLLKRDRIGVTDDFFALGGHSLLAVRLMAEIRAGFRVDLSVRTVFENKTVRTLAPVIDEAKAVDFPRVTKAPEGEPLRLSFAQQRLWLVDQIEPGNCQYNIPLALRLQGVLDVSALTSAFNVILDRHQVLRSTIHCSESDEPIQVVQTGRRLAVPIVDLTGLCEARQEQEVRRCLELEAFRAFDLSMELMLRVQVVKLSEHSHVLLVTLHHIASDAWSAAILIEEFSALYQAFLLGQPNPLPELQLQYADYARWQRNHLPGGDLEEALQFWKERLQGLPEVHNLPLDHPRSVTPDYQGAIYRQTLGAHLPDRLTALAYRFDCTLFMVLSASFAVLLSRHSSEDDIVIGTPVANRQQAELTAMVGFFVNTLVLRFDLADNPTFATMLSRNKEYLLGAYEHQQLPFEKLVEELQPNRNLGYSPLFQVKLALQNNEMGDLRLPGLSVRNIAADKVAAKHDLSLDVSAGEGGLTLVWEYAAALFERSTIERMAAHYAVLLDAIVADPSRRVGELPLLTQEEQRLLLVDWNEQFPELALQS